MIDRDCTLYSLVTTLITIEIIHHNLNAQDFFNRHFDSFLLTILYIYYVFSYNLLLVCTVCSTSYTQPGILRRIQNVLIIEVAEKAIQFWTRIRWNSSLQRIINNMVYGNGLPTEDIHQRYTDSYIMSIILLDENCVWYEKCSSFATAVLEILS